MSLRQRVLHFLSRPVHIHVNLPFHQVVWIKLDTALSYYANEEFESVTFDFQGLGGMFDTDGPRNLSLNVAAGFLGLNVGLYQRWNGGC